ncbi:extracellular solute-binding protein [Melittangium boletus]|uniref:extracellular solute-binding protein n=1 Tax=Melittangium boletus TaxID=83453 RepID=UPI003DA26179
MNNVARVWWRKQRALWGVAVLSGVLSEMGCGEAPPPEETPPPAKTLLRVPLYSYIPDAAGDRFQALNARIEAEFERAHPEVDLVVNPPCFQDDLYEPAQLAASLRGEGACPYEMVEVDTSLLGELVATGAVRSWSALPEGPEWQPAGLTAVRVEGQLYGVPHWQCAHYVHSRSDTVSAARTVDELLAALEGLGTPQTNLAGNLLGSWNLPSLYLDAWTDTHGPSGVQSAVTTARYDTDVLAGMNRLARACDAQGQNPCLDGTYDDDIDLPEKRLARGEADASLGFSERLHVVLKNLPAGAPASALRLAPAPLGQGNQPLLFTDAFTLSARCTGACEQAARDFVAYMTRASTYQWMVLSEDAPAEGRVPRYLMPANRAVYALPAVAADAFYPVIGAASATGGAFPNTGLYGIRKQMRDHLRQALQAR